jgi:hypothetical protein
MAGGHPPTPWFRDFMALNGAPAKRTSSVSFNGPIRLGFREIYVGRKLEDDFVRSIF